MVARIVFSRARSTKRERGEQSPRYEHGSVINMYGNIYGNAAI